MEQQYLKSAMGLSLLTKQVSQYQLNLDRKIPQVGDFIKVGLEISEGQKTRIQNYKGLVLAVKGKGITKSVLVRRAFKGFCSERTILIHSPQVKDMKILNHTPVKKSKLYYVRALEGKRARILTGRNNI